MVALDLLVLDSSSYYKNKKIPIVFDECRILRTIAVIIKIEISVIHEQNRFHDFISSVWLMSDESKFLL